jgi:hypothetical protein
MNKFTERRGQGSADSKKSSQNPHISDEQLLLALDGESSAYEAAQVEVHLEACWSCRARSEQIKKVIGNVVEYRDQLTKPYSPIPTDARSMFVIRLGQVVRGMGRPSLWNRILKALRVFGAISQCMVPRPLWISALVVASLVIFSITSMWHVPEVSASQLLENAQRCETRAFQSVTMPVVYQKLRIQIGSQTVTRTIYRDPVNMRQVDQLDVAQVAEGRLASKVDLRRHPHDQAVAIQTADAQLRQTFLSAHLNWKEPLSPASYTAWHNSLGEKQDEVATVGGDFITLTTRTSEGLIAQARITVRTSDFHPVAEDLRLQDTREVKVNELVWEVLPMESINQAIFVSDATLPPEFKRAGNVGTRSPSVIDAELAEAELQARIAIHAEKADLGEQIELDRDIKVPGQRSLVVRGIVNTSERKNDLQSALRGIPHIQFRLQTVEEAEAQQNEFTAASSQDPTTQIAQQATVRGYGVAENVGTSEYTIPVVDTGRPALEEQMEEHIPIAEDRTAFINKTVELLQGTMARAWALRRLSDRYTPDMVAELGRGSRQTLELLIRDHVTAIRQYVDEVRNTISPLLPPMPVSAVAGPTPDDAPTPTTSLARDWHNAVNEVFLETKRVHDNGTALLAGSGDATSGTQEIRDLQLALSQLEIQLPALYQQIDAPFLTEPKGSGR